MRQTKDLEKLIIGVLTDVIRSGAPPRLRAEQVAGIIALDAERVGTRSGQKRDSR